MKSKNYPFVIAVLAALFFSSCNPKPLPLTTSSSGASLQDTLLPKMLFKLVREGTSNYLAYYWVQNIVVDTTHTPPVIWMAAQSAYYDASSSSSVLHNGTSTSQISSTVSVNTDSVYATCAGPFDMVNGRIYSYKGYLHYANKTVDSCVCPLTEVVYMNQTGGGSPLSIGFITQNDLHSPKPPVRP